MKVLTSAVEVKNWRKSLGEQSLGFVPTMGALHAGHASLIQKAKLENAAVAVSIFVNPTQFNNAEDLEKYPRPLNADLEAAREAGADMVWTPTYDDLYPDGYSFKLTESKESRLLEGEFRPGHFDGVLTVVMKLLNATQATRAYFGEKDFQQLHLIQKMTQAFLMPVEIVPVPTLRETDGLAMSSRNVRLSDQERQLAPQIYQVLTQIKDPTEAVARLTSLGFRVEYLKEWEGRRLIAAWLGKVRLIDNVEN